MRMLIFNAKGNPFGQFLMVIFSMLYGIISFNFKYYGEMITYLGMTMPMALFALISVTTSFLAVYLTFWRSPYFAVAYASNDFVLILLCILASFEDIRYLSVVICFVALFFSDMYGFFSWRKMKKRQNNFEIVSSKN